MHATSCICTIKRALIAGIHSEMGINNFVFYEISACLFDCAVYNTAISVSTELLNTKEDKSTGQSSIIQ